MSNESVVPLFGTLDRDTGVMKGVGPLGTSYTPIGGGTGTVETVNSVTPDVSGNINLSSSNLTDGAALTSAITGKVTNLGIFANTGALPTASANRGNVASVGASAPYVLYTSDGSAWNPPPSGTVTPASTISPKAAGSGTVGTTTVYARQDHSHPINTSVELGVVSTAVLTWNATTNLTSDGQTLASGTAPTNGINTYVVTTSGTTTLDGISVWRAGAGLVPGDLVQFNGAVFTRIAGASTLGTFNTLAALNTAVPPATTNGGERANVGSTAPYTHYISDGVTWLRIATNSGLPVAVSTGTTLANGLDGNTLICSSTPALNLPVALVPGYGNCIKGAFTLAGGLTIGSGVTDLRTTTGVAACSLVQTAADGSTYDLWGTK